MFSCLSRERWEACGRSWSISRSVASRKRRLCKAELIHRRGPWRSLEAVACATLEWVDRFNHRRLLEPIGNIPPAEAEAKYHAAIANKAMAA